MGLFSGDDEMKAKGAIEERWGAGARMARWGIGGRSEGVAHSGGG